MSAADHTISELAPQLASGALSAKDLLNDCLRRIVAHDNILNAMLVLDPRAEAEAEACDAEIRLGRPRGPLHGIPLVVKDNIDIAGLPTSSGCRALFAAMPRAEAAQVKRLRAAGAIILGKSNLSEFSFEIRSRSSLGGDTRNPFLPEATSGGSSGGTAVAVAAGFALAGLGTDTGGSIRVPAAYNGLVGLRPTRGRLDMAGVAPLAPTTDTIGPIARSIEDAALLWSVLSGDTAHPSGVDVSGLRVGVLRQCFGDMPEVIAATEAVARNLARVGVAVVDPVKLATDRLPSDGAHIVDIEFANAFDLYLARNFIANSAPASLDEILASGNFLAEHEPALRRRLKERGGDGRPTVIARHAGLRDALEELMNEHDLDALLYPTSHVTPMTLDNPKGGWAPELAACSGWPALSIPSGKAAHSGVPIGVELLARCDGETFLFRLGRAIEQAAGPRRLPAFSDRLG